MTKVFRVQKINEVTPEVRGMLRRLGAVINDHVGLSKADVFNCVANALGRVVARYQIPHDMAVEAFAEVLARQEGNLAASEEDVS